MKKNIVLVFLGTLILTVGALKLFSPGVVSLDTLPTLSDSPESESYIHNIPDGVYKPMWNIMSVMDDNSHTVMLADVVVLVSNQRRFLGVETPHPVDGLSWKAASVVVYIDNPDHSPRFDSSGYRESRQVPLWVAAIRPLSPKGVPAGDANGEGGKSM